MSPSSKKAYAAGTSCPRWQVAYRRGSGKTLAVLPERAGVALDDLVADLRQYGPEQPDWPGYGKDPAQTRRRTNRTRHRCCLQIGHPSYAAFWDVAGRSIVVDVSIRP